MARLTPKEQWDRGFASGLAYAVAYLARTGGDESAAAHVLGDSGLSIDDFRKAKVAGYDLRIVSRLYRTDPYLAK